MLGTLRVILVACAVLAVPARGFAATTVVNTCGQEFNGDGVLTADLDCTGFDGVAVRVDRTGKLDLAGFTLSGGTTGVFCRRGCTIFSSGARGTIRDTASSGVATNARAITIENVDIIDAGGHGVSGSRSEFVATKIIMQDSSVSGAASIGVSSWDAKITGSTLSGNDVGVDVVKALRLIDSTVSDNTTTGAEGGTPSASFAPQFKPAKVLVLRSTVTGNGEGLRIEGPAIIKDSHIDGNLGPGVVLNRPNDDALRCSNSTFDANGLDGVLWEATLGAKAKLRNCSANDNARHGINTDFALAYLDLFVGSDLQVTGNGGDGLRLQFIDRRVLLKRSTVTGNGGHGVHAMSFGSTRPCGVKLVRDTVVVDNGTGVDCGVAETCADVAACMNDEPEIDSSSTCETSYVLDSGFPGTSWGTCALD